ncbi:hypothetical protein VP1G_10917 [Cytospora mali]|uniref:Uncharacterized protein n=1 Tax=Cytospora mali TaxID=578113 RepID=A0A194V0S1_CYTMA|nr:hypothetical protein VP1G_10917 [Valsa mali var. pyri (nom. inval.)]
MSLGPSLSPQAQQACLLHLPDDTIATRDPLLADLLLVNSSPEHAAGSPVLHQGPRLLLADARDVEHLQARALHDLVGAGVVLPGVGVPGRQILIRDAGLARGLALDGQLHARVARGVAPAGGSDDGAAVGEGGLAGEQVDEHAHDGQVVAVDELEGRVAVVAHLHDEGEAVEGEEHGRAGRGLALERQLVPQRREDAPGLVRLARRLDQRVERRALGDRVGEVLVGPGRVDAVQDGAVGAADVLHQLERVHGLHPLLGVGVGDRNAFDIACSKTKLLPAAFSPETTILNVCPFSVSSFMRLHMCTVSGRTRTCGLWNRPQVWLLLKASLARSWSMVSSGILNTRPALSGATMLAASSRDAPCTGTALLLDSTMRLRQAFLSPGRGVLPWRISLGFLNLLSVMRLPVRWCWPTAWGWAVVENAAVEDEGVAVVVVGIIVAMGTMCLGVDDAAVVEGLRRHLQHD